MNRISFFIAIALAIGTAVFLSIFPETNAGVGSPNATLETRMEISNTAPEVLNVSINDGSAVTLIPNSTRKVSCAVVVVDYDGEADLSKVNATFYDASISSDTDSDDNNFHYTNSSCALNLSYGTYNGYADDGFRALANCTFDVWFYANAGTWTCNASVFDQGQGSGRGYNQGTISELLALGVPDTIDYGIVNATEVSDESPNNVTNFGNVVINLSLEGYARTKGDGNAMNCTLGSIGNISVEHEKFNLTASNPGPMNLTQANGNYTNLTTTPKINFFNLTWRQNDAGPDVSKTTYWRIYVPAGVAGNCTGNIIFGATTAAAS